MIIIGSTETKIDKVRSILAQTFQINLWTVQGIPFDSYIYVPEVHPITGKEFHEHEDEGHVLKVNYAINLLYDLFCCKELVIVHDKVDQINCSLKDFMKLYMMNLQIAISEFFRVHSLVTLINKGQVCPTHEQP